MKIGLVENFTVLKEIIAMVKSQYPEAQIVWDPVLKASAGFTFHNKTKEFLSILKVITLITPNAEEFEGLGLISDNEKELPCMVLLKGGHRVEKKGIDTLFVNGKATDIPGAIIETKADKHGTGCVFSSAVAAYLVKGFDMLASCAQAKAYVEKLLVSNNERLGYHSV